VTDRQTRDDSKDCAYDSVMWVIKTITKTAKLITTISSENSKLVTNNYRPFYNASLLNYSSISSNE